MCRADPLIESFHHALGWGLFSLQKQVFASLLITEEAANPKSKHQYRDGGLVKAFDDYEKKNEAAWRTESITALPKEESTHAPRR
jgi:hypothetical protein